MTAPLPDDLTETTRLLIGTRRHVAPKLLHAPGPDAAQLDALLDLAAAAPDHGRLVPWRFVLVPPDARGRLGDAFAQALLERDPDADARQCADARAKAQRAPLLLVAVARLGDVGTDAAAVAAAAGEPTEIPPFERLVALGAAIQNLLLGAHAMGFGSGLTSGRALASDALRRLLALGPDEHAVCCINVGTAAVAPRPRAVPRPTARAQLQVLGDGAPR